MHLRKTKYHDLDIYWKWFKQPGVSENSFKSQKNVTFASHVKWFNNKLNNDKVLMFVFVNKKYLIGQIRLEKEKDRKIILSYSIDLKYRKKGFGKKIVKLMMNKIKRIKSFHNYKYIAKVKNTNYNSTKIFQSLNFNQRKYKNSIIFTKNVI